MQVFVKKNKKTSNLLDIIFLVLYAGIVKTWEYSSNYATKTYLQVQQKNNKKRKMKL